MSPLLLIAVVYVLILLANLIFKHTDFKVFTIERWSQDVLVLGALALIIIYWIGYLHFLLGA